MAGRLTRSTGGVDDLHSQADDVLHAARIVLERSDATDDERARAFWTLGRAAYYDNRMEEAVRLLQQALPLIDDPTMVAEVLLALAPALSKEGRPGEALAVLADPRLAGETEHAGQLRSLRGIVYIELGRLHDARSETEQAVRLLREAGDAERATRAIVNLAVVASMLGDLDESERLYEEARRLALETQQAVVAAGIEGNLGYIAARRGDFATALDWYERARRSFESFGEVDLLVAVLEVDHARTLLDVGLAVDAVNVADHAARSAALGGNQMLELQSRLLAAEALVRLGDTRSAEPEVRRCHELAHALDHTASARRVAYLAGDLGLRLPGAEPGGEIDEILAFVDAGWGHEAYAWMLRRALRLRRSDRAAARALVVDADRLTASLDVDPVARSTGELLLATVAGDGPAVDDAYERAIRALVEQQEVLGSVELHATIAHQVRPMVELAIASALHGSEPASRVLDVVERARSVYVPPRGRARTSAVLAGQVARLRDARVALAEAKASGGDVATATSRVHDVEREMLRSHRTASVAEPVRAHRPLGPVPVPPPDTVYLTHVVHEGRVLGMRHDHRGTELHDLGELDPIAAVGRTQRAALRRLNDRRRRRRDAELERVRSASQELDERLIAPFALADTDRVVFTPAAQILHFCWGALPSLERRPLTLASTLRDWAAGPEQVAVRRLGFLGGPGLDAVAVELDEIGRAWSRLDAVHTASTADEAARMLARADLVHVSAHGVFRSDNVFFSALVFADRELSLLEMADLERVPSVVVLASCDAGSTGAPTGLDDDVVVGTAIQLRLLGADVVVAPTVAVGDAAAAEFSVGLHAGLVAGRSFDDAFRGVKLEMLGSDDPIRMATAWSFNVMGGRSTRRPVRIGR